MVTKVLKHGKLKNSATISHFIEERHNRGRGGTVLHIMTQTFMGLKDIS